MTKIDLDIHVGKDTSFWTAVCNTFHVSIDWPSMDVYLCLDIHIYNDIML